MKKVFGILVLLFFFCFEVASAGEYYVSQNGGTNWDGCLNEGSPCSLATANSNLRAGDVAHLMIGEYSTSIKPSRSGDASGYITYQKYGNGDVVFDVPGSVVEIGGKDYIKVDGLKIINSSRYWVNISDGDYNIVQNCYMEGGRAWAGIFIGNDGNYNKIINNEMRASCPYNEYCGRDCGGPQDLIQLWGGNYNLIEGNYIGYSGHVAVSLQKRTASSTSYNIIRNNIFDNKWHTNFAIAQGSSRNLFENNIVKNAGEGHMVNHCGGTYDYNRLRYDQHGLQINAPDNIIRKNILYNNGANSFATWQDDSECSNNRVYGNTFYQEFYGIRANSDSFNHVDNIFKNNIIYDSNTYSLFHGSLAQDNGYIYFNNDISGGILQYSNQNDLTYWANNLAVDPGFVDADNKNFGLSPGSRMIDAGDFLTTISSASGRGTSFNVNDARYFMDGWGIIDGDEIQFEGSGKVVRILNVAGNLIRVNESVSWTNGQGVSLAYSGNAPDIGAVEYGGQVSQIRTCQDLGGVCCSACVGSVISGASDCVTCCSACSVVVPNSSYEIIRGYAFVDGYVSEFSKANEIVLTASSGTVGKYRLMWDDLGLYISGEVVDSEVNSKIGVRDGNLWEDDSIELMFDFGNDKGSFMGSDDYKFFVNSDGVELDSRGWDVGWSVDFDSAVRVVDGGYVVEIGIPWSVWGESVSVGEVVGFDLNMNDLRDSGERIFFTWSNENGGSLNDPAGWGDVVFVGGGSVSLDDVFAKIDEWKNGLASLADVLGVVRAWGRSE